MYGFKQKNTLEYAYSSNILYWCALGMILRVTYNIWQYKGMYTERMCCAFMTYGAVGCHKLNTNQLIGNWFNCPTN